MNHLDKTNLNESSNMYNISNREIAFIKVVGVYYVLWFSN